MFPELSKKKRSIKKVKNDEIMTYFFPVNKLIEFCTNRGFDINSNWFITIYRAKNEIFS